LAIYNKPSEAPQYALRANEVTALEAFTHGHSLRELEERTQQMEGRRLQELVVSFGCGLAAFVVIGAAFQRISSGTRAQSPSTHLSSIDTTNVAFE
jgi:hypothetical protein